MLRQRPTVRGASLGLLLVSLLLVGCGGQPPTTATQSLDDHGEIALAVAALGSSLPVDWKSQPKPAFARELEDLAATQSGQTRQYLLQAAEEANSDGLLLVASGNLDALPERPVRQAQLLILLRGSDVATSYRDRLATISRFRGHELLAMSGSDDSTLDSELVYPVGQLQYVDVSRFLGLRGGSIELRVTGEFADERDLVPLAKAFSKQLALDR